ncbi:MAG: right-handed parallel beta-helix repeat-containing protein [Actinobacteria bacterium]|nr:right-handed parallel beta-helix repeat-containing protein [Actinomycetota bacterium]
MEIVRTIQVFIDHTAPSASISAPQDGSTATGLIRVMGTASDEHLDSYVLQYASEASSEEWQQACSPASDQVTDGFLGYWNTEVLSEGDYLLRLTVRDTADHETSATLTLSVENPAYEITSAQVEPQGTCLAVSEQKQFLMVGTDTEGNLHQLAASWAHAEGLGTIDSSGLFTATTLGHGFVSASSGSFSADVPVAVATKLSDTVLSQDITLGPECNPYVLGSWIVVPPGVTLTLEPGTVIKVKEGGFYVEGTLEAGTAGGDKPLFTSFSDDSALGDTNADRESQGSPGDWSAIYLAAGSPSSLQDLKIEYAGEQTAQEIVGGRYVASSAAVVSDQAYVNVRSCEIASSSTAGLSSRFAESVTCQANTFSQVSHGYGLELLGARGINMDANTFTDCLLGALVSCLDAPGGISITGNIFTDCHYGEGTMVVQATESATTVSGNTFYRTTPQGMSWGWGLIVGGTNDTRVTGNHVTNYGSGIMVGSSKKAYVNDNSVEVSPDVLGARGISIAMHVGEAADPGASEMECSGNRLNGDFEPAIELRGSGNNSDAVENTICDNIIQGSSRGDTGIEVICEEAGGTPAPVTVTRNNISTYSEGIRAGDFAEIEVTENTINGAGAGYPDTGIIISNPSGGSSNASVRANQIDITGGVWISTGIEFSQGASGEIVANEVIGGDWSIAVKSNSSASVANNALTSYSTTGIEFNQSSGTISGHALNGGQQGVLLQQSPDITLEGNTISDCRLYGIIAHDAGVVMKSNDLSDSYWGLTCTNSRLAASENTFSGCARAGIVGSGPTVSVQQCTFTNVGDAISWSGYDANVMGNTITGCSGSGIALSGPEYSMDVTVNGNKIAGGSNGLVLGNFHGTAVGNTIKDCYYGVFAYFPHDYPQIRGGNRIQDNGIGVYNEGPEYVDASNNWWGNTSGPAPYGDCNGVSYYVDVQPWVGQSKFYGRVNGHDPHCPSVAEPVNAVTGNFTSSLTDLDFSATGPHIEITRTYNSITASEPDGPMGRGWDCLITQRVEPYMPKYVEDEMLLVNSEGDRRCYYRQADDTIPEDGITYLPEDEDHTVLVKNPDGSWRLNRKDGSFDTFDTEGRIIAVTDTCGNSLAIARDPEGRAVSITDACDQTATLTYNTEDRLSRVTDPAGRHVSYSYDENGNMVEVTDLAGGKARFTYNGNHHLLTVTDPKGATFVKNQFDYMGRVLIQRDAEDNISEFSYDPTAHRSTYTDALCRTTRFSNDSRLYNTGSTDALGQVSSVTYDDDGYLTSSMDRNGNTTHYTYDDSGNMVSETDPAGKTTIHTYDTRGNRLTTSDPLGATTTWTFDAANNVLSERDPLGNTTTYTYDSVGRLLTTTDPLGNTTSNTYDGKGNLTRVENPDGGITVNTYDAANRKLTTTDPMGATTSFTYDEMGHLLTMTDACGGVYSYAYDSDGNQVFETDPHGKVWRTEYDPMGRVSKQIDPLGAETTFAYDANGNKTSETDPLGHATLHAYDELGREVATTDPRGHTSSRTYDPEGNVLTETDREGKATTSTYDVCGRLETRSDPLGNQTGYEYDDCGHEVKVTDPLGSYSMSSYDAAGRLTSSTDAAGAVTRYSYDAGGNRVSVIDPEGHVSTSAYDSMDRLVSSMDPEGRTTTFAYDLNGQKTATADGTGATTTLSYDSRGLLVAATDPLGNVVSYTYDECGRRLSMTDPGEGVTSYTYDECGKLLSETNPLGPMTSYTYDDAGRLLSKTDGMGTTTYTCDENGSPTRVDYPDGLLEQAAYDAEDRPTQRSNQYGPTTFTYDDAGRLTSVANFLGTTSASYDEVGRITGKRVTGQNIDETFSYSYDAAGRMTESTHGTSTATYTYSPAGSLSTINYPNGVSSTYAYDESGMTSGLSISRGADPLKTYEVSRDARADITTITEDGTCLTTYGYDAASRLTSESSPWSGPITYAYDDSGNRLARDRAGEVTTYTYGPGDQLLSDSRGNSYTYNLRGDLVRVERDTYSKDLTWDGKGRLTGVSDTEGLNAMFVYDSLDRTLASSENGQLNIHLHDMVSDVEVATLDGNLSPTALFQGGAGGLVSATTSEGTSYFSGNPHSDVALVTDPDGSVTSDLHYDAWGNVAEPTEEPFGYVGEHQRRSYHSLGLIKMGARFYDPDTGRFISRDPLTGDDELPITKNPYIYANDDPVNTKDLSGKSAMGDHCRVMAGLALLAGNVKAYLEYMRLANYFDLLEARKQKATPSQQAQINPNDCQLHQQRPGSDTDTDKPEVDLQLDAKDPDMPGISAHIWGSTADGIAYLKATLTIRPMALYHIDDPTENSATLEPDRRESEQIPLISFYMTELAMRFHGVDLKVTVSPVGQKLGPATWHYDSGALYYDKHIHPRAAVFMLYDGAEYRLVEFKGKS